MEWMLWASSIKQELEKTLHIFKVSIETQLKILAEKDKNLFTSCDHLQNENKVLKDRLTTLENDNADQERRSNIVHEQLRAKNEKLEKEQSELSVEICKEKERWRHGIRQLKTQVESTTARADGGYNCNQAGKSKHYAVGRLCH